MGSRQVRALNPWRLPACTLHMLRFALLGLPISSAESARTRLVVATQRMHRHKQLQQLRNSAAATISRSHRNFRRHARRNPTRAAGHSDGNPRRVRYWLSYVRFSGIQQSGFRVRVRRGAVSGTVGRRLSKHHANITVDEAARMGCHGVGGGCAGRSGVCRPCSAQLGAKLCGQFRQHVSHELYLCVRALFVNTRARLSASVVCKRPFTSSARTCLFKLRLH
mmetsp:Transcript_2409/g.8672  ORF Transcript_2409/g.8672 Transcript_2409/m.8672 type:complete len:222 (+) Transcript_2409:226-891(+)